MKSQSGNALWFILIAVALLGALTMVLSKGTSNVDQSANVEQARIKASQIMRYAKSVEIALQQLQQTKGCSENEISFENTTDTNYSNGNSPSDESCHMFQPEGAGLTWTSFGQTPLTGITTDTGFTGDIMIRGLEGDTSGSGNELIFFAKVSESLCTQINKELSISGATMVSGITTWAMPFTGAFSGGIIIPDDGGAAFAGKSAGCLTDDNGDFVFYNVILAR